MSSSNTWQALSVQEFVNTCNWQRLLLQTASKSINYSRESLISWQSLTTFKFFNLNNWNGQTNILISQEDLNFSHKAIAFSLTLPLNQFWQAFSWSDQQKILQEQSSSTVAKISTVPEHSSTKNKEFTLKNLSQLF
jgi:hypothetical protein